MIEVKVPRSLGLKECIEFAKIIDNLENSVDIMMDFTNMRWIEPFPMLYLANKIKIMVDRSLKGRVIRIKGCENCGYAAHMGFFRAFGLSYGREVKCSDAGGTYLSIDKVDLKLVRQEAERSAQAIGVNVQRHAENLAGTLIQEYRGQAFDFMSYCFREIIRNVGEHSGADDVLYCGQYWPSKGVAEIALLDAGHGIRRSLSENKSLCIENDAEALLLSVKPGVSRIAESCQGGDESDEWANSGFGLFVTSQMCAQGGRFVICSGDTAIVMEDGNIYKYSTFHKGTAILLRVNLNKLSNLMFFLSRIVAEGERMARNSTDMRNVKASAASKRLQ